MTNLCARCGAFAEEELSIRHRKCAHVTHADCLELDGSKKNYNMCGNCSGAYEALPVATKKPDTARVTREPRIVGNRDYVLEPGVRNMGSLVTRVAAYIPGLAHRVAETVETSKNPFFLLQHREPLTDVMIRNGLGLDHYLANGVTMRDFLINGYTWSDLQVFEDISKKGPKRALQAISTGLQTSANDFRDYPDALPVQAVQQATQFKRADLCTLFGLTFPDQGAMLECDGNGNWNAADCVQLGLQMTDLMDFGLGYVHQYEELMAGLSQEDAVEAERGLKVSPKHIDALVDLEQEAENQRRRDIEQLQRHTARHRREPLRVEAPVEQEVQEEERPNATFNPPAAGQRDKYTPNVYEIRSKQRGARHGALIK